MVWQWSKATHKLELGHGVASVYICWSRYSQVSKCGTGLVLVTGGSRTSKRATPRKLYSRQHSDPERALFKYKLK